MLSLTRALLTQASGSSWSFLPQNMLSLDLVKSVKTLRTNSGEPHKTRFDMFLIEKVQQRHIK